MNSKINADLARKIEAIGQTEPTREIPVIVTTRAGADLAVIGKKGLKVERIFESISAVAGTIPAGKIADVALLDEVELIEYDAEATIC